MKWSFTVQSLLDLRKGSKATRLESFKKKNQIDVGEGSSNPYNKHYANSDTDSDAILYSLCSDTTEESDNEPDDVNDFDMDLSDDNLNGDDDATRFGVFIYNNFTETPKSTYFSPTITSSSLDFIHNLLNETPANELTYFVSNPVYTDAQTTSAMFKQQTFITGNVFGRECSSYTISTSKENSLVCNDSPTKLTPSQSKEADAKGEREYEED
ncbi:hypothetical protein Tco_1055909 [Tanacetum coccineum]|uniref:Uncharacterized protein n=1 Tax=Tanacetum coccineum TaxID=301880 RepID=A0ABQ5H2S5_9ASTR